MGFNASPFSGRNTSVSTSANKNVHPILNDPDVLSLERLLRVKSKVELRLPGRLFLEPPPVSVPLNQAGGCNEIVGENERITGLLEVDTAYMGRKHAVVAQKSLSFLCGSVRLGCRDRKRSDGSLRHRNAQC